MACTKCYTDYISCGVETITVKGELQPSTVYTWVLTTPSGAKFSQVIITDNAGHFTISTLSLPNGLLNPYAGDFVLEVQTDDCTPAIWNDSAYCTPYFCIEFNVTNGNHVKATLGCDCQ